MEFANPCTVLPIEIVQPMHFNDHTHFLRDPLYSQDWTIDDLASSPTDVNCGNMVVSFEYGPGGSLDTDIFRVVMDSDPYRLEILSIDDASKENVF